MEGNRENFERAVHRVGRYSESEALAEAEKLKHKIAAGEAADLNEAERAVAEAKVEDLIAAGRGMEAIRISLLTHKARMYDDFVFRVTGTLRQKIEEAETEEEQDRLLAEWDAIEHWRNPEA